MKPGKQKKEQRQPLHPMPKKSLRSSEHDGVDPQASTLNPKP